MSAIKSSQTIISISQAFQPYTGHYILQRRLGAKPRSTGAAELVVAPVTNYLNRGDVARGTLHGVR